MVEIELSMIPDADIDLQVMKSLLARFSEQTGVKVKLDTMTWGTAWTDFITIASHGKGPDISHIGGTWVSSLATMNALRPFSPQEVELMGGDIAFLAPTWQSSMLYGDDRVWAIPWTGYTYVVCYRRDLLGEAGIDGTVAFGSIESLSATLRKLVQSNLEIPWLIPSAPAPYSDLVHLAASLIWEAGGDYVRIDETGEEIVFNSPQAMSGLKAWLELYRYNPKAYANLNQFDGSNLFARGKAAVVVSDNRFASTVLLDRAEDIVKKNVGFAPLTGSPWYGGASLVIWRHTQGYPDKERAAVELVHFLTGREAEERWGREVHSLPARKEVLEEIYPAGNPLSHTFTQASELGRAYPAVPLWRRLEYQIAQGLYQCLQEALDQGNKDIETILHEHMDPLAERLNLTLKG
jgi:multiple sugar transport system substrate-binding protein